MPSSIYRCHLELIGFVLPKLLLHASLLYKVEAKSASCTTTSLFIVIFSKNSFFRYSFRLSNCFVTAFVLKSGCKGMKFFDSFQIFRKKKCCKTCVFSFDWQNNGKTWAIHLLLFTCARYGVLWLPFAVTELGKCRIAPAKRKFFNKQSWLEQKKGDGLRTERRRAGI